MILIDTMVKDPQYVHQSYKTIEDLVVLLLQMLGTQSTVIRGVNNCDTYDLGKKISLVK